ncbi:hypothetical protein ACFY4C_16065 [Actinomadura viridis]|uniref:hypothetical protein n=1 Tax=Actinomadura viridis TaxID=58110 RepID=UPI0036C552B7
MPESLNDIPVAVITLWALAVAGWSIVAAGLYRGMSGFPRRTALIAHTLSAPGVVLVSAMLGLGALYGMIAATAEWWALALITGFRPERLVAAGSLPRLAAWSALTALTVSGATPLVFHG